MPLDNAQFIAELDPNSPAGTDPINQGDDHIRQTKLATQQSFPNVASAVPQTGVQMAQMAIKNEINTFTQENIFQNFTRFRGVLLALDGSAGAPAYTFENEQSTGLFRFGAQVVDMAIAGNTVFRFVNNSIRALQPFRAVDGTASLPGISFQSSQDMGFRRLSSTIMVGQVGASERMRWQANDATLFTLALAGSTIGSAAVPSYSWFNDRDSGMFNFGGGTVGFAVNSDKILGLVTGGLVQMDQTSAAGGIDLQWRNSAGLPAYSWQYEGTGGFQPGQFSLSRFNRTTGAFIDIPLYINATTGRVHSKLPILTP